MINKRESELDEVTKGIRHQSSQSFDLTFGGPVLVEQGAN